MYNNIIQAPSFYRVGLYIRLSESDEDKTYESESESIINQRNLLMDYVKMSGYTLVDEYVDDGMKFEEVKTVCHLAKEMGVASISLSAGCYDAVEYAIQPMFIPQGFIIPFAKELKAEIDIPVIVAARLNDAHLI